MPNEQINWFDRRKHFRYPAQHGSFAAFSPEYHILGPIHDISKGGIAFYYCPIPMTDVVDKELLVQNEFKLNIFLKTENFFISDINIKLISIISSSPANYPGVYISTVRLGMQFEDLTFDQESRLDYFLKNYIIKDIQAEKG